MNVLSWRFPPGFAGVYFLRENHAKTTRKTRKETNTRKQTKDTKKRHAFKALQTGSDVHSKLYTRNPFSRRKYALTKPIRKHQKKRRRLEHLGQELFQARVLRVCEELMRSVLFLDYSVVDEHHAVCDFAGESHLMGYDNHRHTGLCQVLHQA